MSLANGRAPPGLSFETLTSATAPNVTVDVAAPNVTVDVAAPSVTIPSVTVDVAAPTLNVAAPSVSVAAPTVNVAAPTLNVAAPTLNVAAPTVNVDVAAPFLNIPNVSVDVAAPSVTISSVDIAAPAVTLNISAGDVTAYSQAQVDAIILGATGSCETYPGFMINFGDGRPPECKYTDLWHAIHSRTGVVYLLSLIEGTTGTSRLDFFNALADDGFNVPEPDLGYATDHPDYEYDDFSTLWKSVETLYNQVYKNNTTEIGSGTAGNIGSDLFQYVAANGTLRKYSKDPNPADNHYVAGEPVGPRATPNIWSAITTLDNTQQWFALNIGEPNVMQDSTTGELPFNGDYPDIWGSIAKLKSTSDSFALSIGTAVGGAVESVTGYENVWSAINTLHSTGGSQTEIYDLIQEVTDDIGTPLLNDVNDDQIFRHIGFNYYDYSTVWKSIETIYQNVFNIIQPALVSQHIGTPEIVLVDSVSTPLIELDGYTNLWTSVNTLRELIQGLDDSVNPVNVVPWEEVVVTPVELDDDGNEIVAVRPIPGNFGQAGDPATLRYIQVGGLKMGDVLVNKIKITATEVLDDPPRNAPITCQALLKCADEAQIRASNGADGYHTLPPSGRKIHEYIASLNLNGAQIPKRPARMQNSLYRAVGTSYNDSAGVVYDNWEAIDYDGLDHIAFGIGRSDTDAALVADGYVVRSGIVFTDGGFPSTNSFRTLVTGYYRFTNTMSFSSTVARANIISRFTKSADGNDPFTDFGPLGASAYIRGSAAGTLHDNSSTTITDIVHCNAGDYVGVRLTKEANGGDVLTPGGLSNFMAEFLYAP